MKKTSYICIVIITQEDIHYILITIVKTHFPYEQSLVKRRYWRHFWYAL